MLKYISLLISSLWLFNAEAQNCLIPGTCPAATLEVCDTTQNDPGLWNNFFWWDAPNMNADNAEDEAPASFTFTQNCGGALTIYYQLYLDLNHDNIPETLVDSRDLPEVGTVHYGNLFSSPLGEEILPFDTRTVAPGELYQFALETAQNGNEHTARLRWNTPDNPQTYVDPQLPCGQHYIRWVAEEAGGEQIECSYNIKVRDCEVPTIVCLNSLSVNIMPTQMVTLWYVDFLQYIEDNTSPESAMTRSIRKAGQGSGFPLNSQGEPQVSLTFFCSEIGLNEVEVWVKDAAGNASYCTTTLTVADPFGNCTGDDTIGVALCARQWCSGAPVIHVEGLFQNDNPIMSEFTLYDDGPDASGCMNYTAPLIPGANYTFTPQLNQDPLNGVDALDLARISQYILSTNTLSPYAQIAADVNKSNTITNLDIITIRNLLLGLITEFPSASSWRFIDANTTFSNPNYAFTDVPFVESKTFSSMSDLSLSYAFTAIKTGDVNCSASPGLNGAAVEERAPVALHLPDLNLNAGEVADLDLKVSTGQEWLAMQLGLQFDPGLLSVEAVEAGNLPNPDDLSLAQPVAGKLNAVWFSPSAVAMEDGEAILHLRLRALSPLRLPDALRLTSEGLPSEAFDAAGERHPLVLSFTRGEGATASVGSAYPNPGATDVSLPVCCPEATFVQLQLVDVQGKTVFSLRQELSGGTHLLTIPASAFGTAGLYGWQLNAGGQVWTGKLIRI